MSRRTAFRAFRATADKRHAAESADQGHVEATLRLLVAAIPTQAGFDAWVSTFPAEYQADIRLRFAPYCTFPRAVEAQ